MKVVLRENVEKVGRRGEIVSRRRRLRPELPDPQEARLSGDAREPQGHRGREAPKDIQDAKIRKDYEAQAQRIDGDVASRSPKKVRRGRGTCSAR